MENTIILILRNVKHDGDMIGAGTLIEAAEGAFLTLIEAAAARVVEGATSLEHAAEIVKEQVASGEAVALAAKAAAPKDTWAPTAPAAPAAETTTETTEEKAPGTEVIDADKPVVETTTETTTVPEVGAGDVAPAAPAGGESGDNL